MDAKSNLVPRAADSPLYRLHSVVLPNPEPPLYPKGANVQAITRVVLPIQPSGAANADDMKIEGWGYTDRIALASPEGHLRGHL
jgi:hypothetical protein